MFPGSATAGNVTLVDHSLTYQFRVSAAVMVDGNINEGELSAITINTTLFVPKPGALGNTESACMIFYCVNLTSKSFLPLSPD